MAHKDEYEVARLLLDGGDQVARTFGDVEKVTWNLHPPMLRAMGMKRKLCSVRGPVLRSSACGR
jgi:indolepyruvate ferredoxin oxidoreductase